MQQLRTDHCLFTLPEIRLSIEGMPMAISGSAPEAEELSPTDCSEDSVEIRTPRPVLRPKALPLHAAVGVHAAGFKRKWTEVDRLDDKRRRLDADLLSNCSEIGGPIHPAGAPIFPPLAHYAALPLSVHEERHRALLNQWLMSRHPGVSLTSELPAWTSWTPLLTPHQAPFPYFHPSALIGGYPTPFPYLPPPMPTYAALPPIFTPAEKLTPPVDRSSPIQVTTPPPASPLTASRPTSVISVDEPAPIVVDPTPIERPIVEERPKMPKKLDAGRKRKVRKEKPITSDADKKPAPFLSVERLLAAECKTGVESASSSSETEKETPKVCEEVKSGAESTRPAYREPPMNRNYKNMTRERRMQANARERTRVHTISAAFESLRRAVPSFSHGQRLSKLSILRVASAYIMALGRLADEDAESSASLSDCVDLCTKTLMTEGQMLRRRRDQRPERDDDDDDC